MISLDACETYLSEAPNCLRFLRTWLHWRGEGLVPSVENVRPEDMGAALPSLCVLEWSSPDNITYRLAGSSHADATGRELKGESLIELMAPGDRQVAIERARIITSRPCGGLSTGQAVRPSGYKTPFRNLTLPVLPRSPHELHRAYIALDTYGDPVGPVEEPISKISLGDDHSYIDIGYGASA